MMKNIYFILRLRSAQAIILVLAGIFYSCEKTEPTSDKVEYSATREKAPTINKNSTVDAVKVIIDDVYKWEVDIDAPNGIDSIFVNDISYLSYGNGQIKYSMTITDTMPSTIGSQEISIRVKDEIGLETTQKLTLNISEPFSPYLIADFPFGGDSNVVFLEKDANRRVHFPEYNVDAASYITQNFAWADVKAKSDIYPEINIRYGSPGFSGQTDKKIILDHWEKCVEFGGTTAPIYGDLAETFALRLNLYPYKGNLRTMMVLDQPINKHLIAGIVDSKSRVIKIDVYVKTTDGATHPFISDTTGIKNLKPYSSTIKNHAIVGLGMGNTVKFDDRFNDKADKPPLRERSGQDHGMITTMQKTNEWETLTFAYMGTPANTKWAEGTGKVYTTNDVKNNEVDMLILVVSPAVMVNTSDATYYFRNFRIEDK